MFKTIFIKEFKAILTGPKFIFTFLITLLLLMLAIYLGILDYQSAIQSYNAGEQLSLEEMNSLSSWSHFKRTLYRKPDPLKIFTTGITNDIGRYSSIDRTSPIKLEHSTYSDDPIFAVFRHLDYKGFVLIVLSLFAILFSFDAISGEKENGTLRLTFANAVPRKQYITAKFTGICSGLLLPVILSILISLLLIMAFNIQLDSNMWIRMIIMISSTMIYFVFFIAMGLFISSVTQKSSTSFLLLLIIWITLVLIIPRIGVMAAGRIKPVPSVAEIDAQIEGHSKQRWDSFTKELEQMWNIRNVEMTNMDRSEREIYQDDHMWEWIEQEDALRKNYQKDINEYSTAQYNLYYNQKREQEQLAFTLAQLSPAAAFELLMLNVAETDIHLKSRTEQNMQDYKNILNQYLDNKEKSETGITGLRVTIASEAGFKLEMGRNTSLDISGVPEYNPGKTRLSTLLFPSLKQIMVLLLYTSLCISGAFIAFNRYDVR